MHNYLFLPLFLMLVGCTVKLAEPVRVVGLETAGPRAEQEQPAAPSGTLVAAVAGMAAQLDQQLKARGVRTLPMAIAPFVDLHAPQQARSFGDEVAELFFHELGRRGYNLIDTRALPFAEGEGMAARELPKLTEFYRQHRISYVLSGTFAGSPDGAVLSARMLDSVTRQVIATAQAELPAAALEGSLPGYDPFSSRDGLIIENGGVPQ